jgi:DNA-binding NarL/FixJ family response regulator
VFKQRPSGKAPSRRARSEPEDGKAHVSYWLKRVFKNSFTRGGQTVTLRGWSVKIQYQGRRHTFSLAGQTRQAAAIEAKGLYEAVLAEGWETTLRNRSRRGPGEASIDKGSAQYWREQLVTRRYHFPASSQPEGDLSARISHAGVGYFFPLGSVESQVAAETARRIYLTALEHGWECVFRDHSRELVVGFEWSSNPVIWTYTTIHTLVKEPPEASSPSAQRQQHPPRVAILETDAGIRRSLAWCINQEGNCRSISCESVEALTRCLAQQMPQLVLLNRALASQLGFDLPGHLAAIPQGALALTYSVAVDGDQMFGLTPGGAEAYLFKRVKPGKILDPLVSSAGQLDLRATDCQARVRSYFKGLLRVYPNDDLLGLAKLTRRERDVLLLLSKGHIDKEIAGALGISVWTVHGYIKSIFSRMHVRTRTEAVARYLER